MKTTVLVTTALLTITLLTACGSKQETYTADYLYANDDVRAKVLTECAENKQSDSNCKNANEAQDKKTIEQLNSSMRK